MWPASSSGSAKTLSPGSSSHDDRFLDEQFELATASKTLLFAFAALICWSSRKELVMFGALLSALILAAHNGVVSMNISRRVCHCVCTYAPLILATALLSYDESSSELSGTNLIAKDMLSYDESSSEFSGTNLIGKDMIRVRLGILAVVPVLVGIYVRLPFWECLLWSRLTTLALVSASWYRLASPEEWATQSAHFVFAHAMHCVLVLFALITLLTAFSLEEVQRENFKLRHKESTAIIGAVSHGTVLTIHSTILTIHSTILTTVSTMIYRPPDPHPCDIIDS
jgi:hypothetical protein